MHPRESWKRRDLMEIGGAPVALPNAHIDMEQGASPAVRLRRFFRKSLIGTAVGLLCVSLLAHESRMFTEERAAGHPLWAAIDAAEASALSTAISVWSAVVTERPATMADLKEWAGRLVPPGSGEVDFYSIVEEGYRAVYFEGADSRGGTWIASARHLSGVKGVELAFHHDLYGRLDDLRSEVYAARSRLERAAGRPLPGAVSQIRIAARPSRDGDLLELASRIIEGAGGRVRVILSEGERVVAKGYTPRLAGGIEDGGAGPFNLEVAIAPRGRAHWIELGWPEL